MFERCLYFNLNALTRKVNRIWEAEFRQTGLSAPHAYVMRLVLSEPGISQKQLAEELHLDPSTVTRFVDALVERGLVRRDASRSDRRSSAVFPTAEGKRLLRRLEKIGEVLYQTMRTRIGDKPFQELVRGLREARSALEKS
ncbi:MAG TPA: MarR family transcriptional regulator [Sedimenticola thiotaurini]|uniref:MarR family transcriptional regulator n=1 Tax=Sedimenticola thiotaurini TaxID=1543721 RepID=A0A831W8D7_9GAMM|nr:MarR family transcriptional regulator [Sedimenticola thiotaurini]